MTKPEELAMESIKRWGFVVCKYHPWVENPIGHTSPILWFNCKMPQNFTPIREATQEEWMAQCALFTELVGKPPGPWAYEPGTPYILITD